MTNETNGLLRNSVQPPLEPAYIWYWFLRCVISILAMMGNGLVIYIIYSKRHLRVTNNWFVLSLAIADFCVGFFTTSSGLACTFYFTCDRILQLTFYNFLFFASALNLWAMAIDRYISTVHSLRYVVVMTNTRVIILVGSAWGVSLVTVFARLFWAYDGRLVTGNTEKYYAIFMDLFLGVLSCVVLLAIYFRILHISRKLAKQTDAQRQQIAFNAPNAAKARRSRSGRSTAQVLGAIVILFVMCYSLNIYFSFCKYSKLCSVPRLGVVISLLLIHLNSAVNFTVYGFMKNDIRTQLKNLFKWPRTVGLSESRDTSFTQQGNLTTS